MNSTESGPVSKEPTTTPASAPDRPGVLVFPPLLFLGTLLTGLAVQYLWPARLGLPGWARILAGSLFAAGLALLSWGRTRMVRAGTNVFPNRPTLAIVTDGPFRFTRNPLYLGNVMVYLSLTLMLDSLWLLLLAPVLVSVLRWGVIAREERYLEAKFGELYLAYKARVRRWL